MFNRQGLPQRLSIRARPDRLRWLGFAPNIPFLPHRNSNVISRILALPTIVREGFEPPTLALLVAPAHELPDKLIEMSYKPIRQILWI